MLDKSIPYYNVIMKRADNLEMQDSDLPTGFSIVLFNDGDEKHWAAIETSVGEFDSEEEALSYFKKEYIPHLDELKKRSIFIQNQDGEKVATFTAWWNYTTGRYDPSVHWVGVKPEFQGLGLGTAITIKGLRLMKSIDNGKDIFIHTQTWSYKAIGIYLKCGFEIIKDEAFGTYQNDYEKAMPILRDKINFNF